SLPRKGHRVGLHIVLFEACSAFTRVTACTLALSPIRDTHSEGFSYFVTSIAAPVASGWSGCRVGLAPTGKRRLITAHTPCRHSPRSRVASESATTLWTCGYSITASARMTARCSARCSPCGVVVILRQTPPSCSSARGIPAGFMSEHPAGSPSSLGALRVFEGLRITIDASFAHFLRQLQSDPPDIVGGSRASKRDPGDDHDTVALLGHALIKHLRSSAVDHLVVTRDVLGNHTVSSPQQRQLSGRSGFR